MYYVLGINLKISFITEERVSYHYDHCYSQYRIQCNKIVTEVLLFLVLVCVRIPLISLLVLS